MRGDLLRDEPANVVAGQQEGQCCLGVRGEVGGRILRRSARGAADTAVIIAKHGDPVPCEMVGNQRERLDFDQRGYRFVAVLRAAAGDQDHGRMRACWLLRVCQ